MKKVDRFLNSDILFEILSRIPVKSLLGFKCISREWHRIISSCSFAKAQLENTELVLTGFIFQEKFMYSNEDIKTISYVPVETRVAKVPQMVFNFLPEDVVVLASCKGLVCCRSCIPSPQPTIYVCNPATKEWMQLEWPAYDRKDSIALAFDLNLSKDSTDMCIKFKLVRVKQVENNEEELNFTFELYSSETGAWRKSNEICQCPNNLIKNKGIYIGGVLHWLTDGFQVLTFNVENELSWLVSAPVPAFEYSSVPEACIGEFEGRLHYVLVSEEALHVWSLEDYYESKWTLSHWKSLEEIESEHPQFFFNLKKRVSERVSIYTTPWMDPLGFKDGLLLMKVCANLYQYDIKSNNMVQTCSIEEMNSKSMYYPTVLPHTLSLIPLNLA